MTVRCALALIVAFAAGCAGRSKLEVGSSGGTAGAGGTAGTTGTAGTGGSVIAMAGTGGSVIAVPLCNDTRTDPAHCGRCFHSCEGGECVDGACQPVRLRSTGQAPTALAVDAFHIWTASPLSFARKDGAIAAATTVSGTVGDIWSIAVDGTHAYWINVSGGLQRAQLPSGTGGQSGTDPLGDPGYRVALDDESFYFTSSSSVTRIAKSLEFRQVLAEMPGEALAVDETFVYFSVPSGGGLFRVPKDGGEPEALTNETSAFHIAAWNGTVFVSEQSAPPGVFHVTGPGLRTLVASVEEPYGVAVDGSGVFYVDWLDGSIWVRTHEPGAEPQRLASGQPFPRNVALDERAVYWTNDDLERSVMKVAKP